MKRSSPWSLAILVLALGALAGAQETKKDADPLAVGAEWKGKLTQKGKIKGNKDIPAEFQVVMVITQRKDKEFECELREKIDDSFVTYLCKGKFAAGDKETLKLDFESVFLKSASEGFISVPRAKYTGTVNGKTLKGTWKYPVDTEDTELEGEFNFER